MRWIIFWLIINSAIGYLVGKPKDRADVAVLLSILLGAIGWLIARASTSREHSEMPILRRAD
ncbi:MAG TPA: hypothetical protein VFO30_08490 [Chthoniobacterales bacterium]|nr:hypothetical protein [Chthoniobacterales bacterium]